MPHVIQRQLKNSESTSCVGLVDADLRDAGGHRVMSAETAFKTLKSAPTILHSGGETLACDLAYGFSMTLQGQAHAEFTDLMRIDPEGATEIARDQSGFKGQTAYVIDANSRWDSAKSAFHAVGLAEPENLDAEAQKRLFETLSGADFVGIRDSNGAEFLEKNGIEITRMPCGVSVLPTVCKPEWALHSAGPAMAEIRDRFPNGYFAVQVSGYRRRILKPLTQTLSKICARTGLGVVFFAAGTASGHDDIIALAKQARSFPRRNALFFPSRNVWDIAALIGNASMYVGTSLHGRIVAMAAGIPRINLDAGFSKIARYCELWEHMSMPYELPIDRLEEEIERLIVFDRGLLEKHTHWLQKVYFDAFAKLCQATNLQTNKRFDATPALHSAAIRTSENLISEWASNERTLRMLRRISRRKKKKNLETTKRTQKPVSENSNHSL